MVLRKNEYSNVMRARDMLQPTYELLFAANESSFNPLSPNSDQSQTSHCSIKGLSVSEVMRIENMITQVKFY